MLHVAPLVLLSGCNDAYMMLYKVRMPMEEMILQLAV
jgi:hypothetical protein